MRTIDVVKCCIQGPMVQLRQVIDLWWEADCGSKIKPLFHVVPIFDIWKIWKRRNTIGNGGTMSMHTKIMEINNYLYLFAKSRYAWLRKMHNTWPLIFKILEEYIPLICSRVVYWKHSPMVDIQSIKGWMVNIEVEGVNIFREGNNLANFLINHVAPFGSIDVKI
ncbi:hypothetical protein H5410_002890 [Solanum commersonii]|uniref:Uncharacterized protein n=1 Tax=Solanum commersonii TaxID=4109 RepID=A0A9J6B343_SOLCO|nr:hypothetical protein H5410_002890 [Solanum commersonii]